jgi:hypothetical protein
MKMTEPRCDDSVGRRGQHRYANPGTRPRTPKEVRCHRPRPEDHPNAARRGPARVRANRARRRESRSRRLTGLTSLSARRLPSHHNHEPAELGQRPRSPDRERGPAAGKLERTLAPGVMPRATSAGVMPRATSAARSSFHPGHKWDKQWCVPGCCVPTRSALIPKDVPFVLWHVGGTGTAGELLMPEGCDGESPNERANGGAVDRRADSAAHRSANAPGARGG